MASWYDDGTTPAGWARNNGTLNITITAPDGEGLDPYTYSSVIRSTESGGGCSTSVHSWNSAGLPYGSVISAYASISYTNADSVTQVLNSDVTEFTVTTIAVPTITHEMTLTEQYTTGTVYGYDYTGVEAELYQAGFEAETRTVAAQILSWAMDPPTGWVAGQGDKVKYRAYLVDTEGVTHYSDYVEKTITGVFYPAQAVTAHKIYINDDIATFQWAESRELPTDWSYVSAVFQGRTITRAGVLKHSISQSFDPTSGSVAITVTDCPRYSYGDYINFRVQITYTDGTNTYTIGSRTTTYMIDTVKAPTITHHITTTEPYTTGTSNSYDYYIRARYYVGSHLAETLDVPVASDGTWTMTPPQTVTVQIDDMVMYEAMWDDGSGGVLFSHSLSERITE